MRCAAIGLPLALLAIACSTTSRDSLPIDPADASADADPQALARAARAAFDRAPRTPDAVREAAAAMRTAALAADVEPAARYRRLVDAARYHVWLARHAGGDDPAPALDAVRLTNTAIELDPGSAPGFYWRAVAVGLVAEADIEYGLDAVDRVRDDARRALELDDAYAAAGAHRVLGALYLEAPGPPLGPGSLRRARFHLRNAVAIAPDDPGNLTYLALALQESSGDPDEIARITARARAAAAALDDPAERDDWLRRIAADLAADG